MREKSSVVGLGAVAAILGSSAAFADTANINFYGTVNLDVESVKAASPIDPNAAIANRFRIVSNSTNFGLKGVEEISGGLKAVWQIETGLNPASGALSSNSSSQVINLRNSMLGASGGFGTASLGKWDTPFKLVGLLNDPFYGTGVGYMTSIADTIGQGAASMDAVSGYGSSSGDRVSFNRRQGQALQYWSPTYYNTTIRLMYSPDSDRSGTQNPYLLSGSIVYMDDALNAGFAYEQHTDFQNGVVAPVTSVTGNQSKDTGLKAAAGYKLPFGLQVGAMWTNLKFRQTVNGSGDSSYSRNSLTFTATQKIDAFTIRGGYAHAADGSCDKADGSACDVSGLGATHATFGGSYSLSARTDVYGVFSKIWNGNGNYNFMVNPLGTSGVLPRGADPQAIGVGLRHVF